MLRVASAVVLMLALVGVVAAAPKTFDLTPENTKITFVGTKKEGKHDGGFKTVSGTFTVDGTDPKTGKFSVDIDVDSIWTDTDKLTAHLKSADFFEVKTYPKAKFVSTKIAQGEKGYTVTGDLTLHGQTKPVTFPADITVDDKGVTLKSDFKINRHDWNISYGKGKVDDDVSLKVVVQAKK
jgi:polyisoprenoid-binding protein YceI